MIEIYELLDPDTGACRYVGKSRRASKRFSWHMWAARSDKSYRVYRWIRSLLRRDRKPVLSVIETCEDVDAATRERFWIEQRELAGYDLTNCTRGGEGLVGYKHTAETKRKIGAAHKGKVLSEETRLRVSIANKGRPNSASWFAKMLGRKGRKLTESERAAHSARMKGNTIWKLAKPREKPKKVQGRGWPHGERGVNAKMTNAQAREARRLFADGATQAELMRRFNVSRVDIHRVVRGKTYKYIGE